MKNFKPYNLDKPMLVAPDMRDWLPFGHLAEFVSDVIEAIDLSSIYDVYHQRSRRGQPPTDPRLLLKLLIYGYSTGVRSARRIEKATYEDVAFRFLAGDTHPDHDVIAHFRSEHSEAFAEVFLEVFLEVLRLCQKAGLVKLSHVSLDGTKIKANAKKSKSRKYSQLLKSESQLEKEIRSIIADAEGIDKAEDAKFGRGRKDSDLPKELMDRKRRLSTIKALIAEMDAEKKVKAEWQLMAIAHNIGKLRTFKKPFQSVEEFLLARREPPTCSLLHEVASNDARGNSPTDWSIMSWQ